MLDNSEQNAKINPKYSVFNKKCFQTIRDRIIARGEKEDCWCLQNINICLETQNKEKHAFHIVTVDKTTDEIVSLI